MSSSKLLWAALLNGAILQYHPVITRHSIAFCSMTLVDIIDSPVLRRASTGAMNYDIQYVFHGFHRC